jgi:hypothetical protein
MGSTISRSFFLPIYWLRKIGDLQLELRSSNPSQGSIKQSFVFLKMVYFEGKRTPDGFDNKPFIFLANLLA